MLRFHPRPTIAPSSTTTAPTGTSPISKARCAQRTASSIQSSSDNLSLSKPVEGSETRFDRVFLSDKRRNSSSQHSTGCALGAERNWRMNQELENVQHSPDDFGYHGMDDRRDHDSNKWISENNARNHKHEPRSRLQIVGFGPHLPPQVIVRTRRLESSIGRSNDLHQIHKTSGKRHETK